MTLDEAIIHCDAVAWKNKREAKRNRDHGGWDYDDRAKRCAACAADHEQLAEWLRELKDRRAKDEQADRCGKSAKTAKADSA